MPSITTNCKHQQLSQRGNPPVHTACSSRPSWWHVQQPLCLSYPSLDQPPGLQHHTSACRIHQPESTVMSDVSTTMEMAYPHLSTLYCNVKINNCGNNCWITVHYNDLNFTSFTFYTKLFTFSQQSIGSSLLKTAYKHNSEQSEKHGIRITRLHCTDTSHSKFGRIRS